MVHKNLTQFSLSHGQADAAVSEFFYRCHTKAADWQDSFTVFVTA
jgi:hypothetical protein